MRRVRIVLGATGLIAINVILQDGDPWVVGMAGFLLMAGIWKTSLQEWGESLWSGNDPPPDLSPASAALSVRAKV